MDEFKMIKNTLMSIKQHASSIKNFPNETELNDVIKQFNIRCIGNKIISIEVANYLKLENGTFNKYIKQIAEELHMNLEGLYKVNSVDSEADAYYIYL
ncbi:MULTISPECIES: hypothetical protein [unclassified Enterococcus]|uniref:hypothetical protein n=1 Tax=unclassified Enterococcus TaxID=2608891 RepID=UPI0013EA66CB|nr:MULTISPECIES: hypothetical protein [unclassified Enterococcus]